MPHIDNFRRHHCPLVNVVDIVRVTVKVNTAAVHVEVQRPYWVVVFESSVLLKQLIGQDLEQGMLTFHSLNPSPEYADFTISENDVRHLYYVIKKKPRQMDF